MLHIYLISYVIFGFDQYLLFISTILSIHRLCVLDVLPLQKVIVPLPYTHLREDTFTCTLTFSFSNRRPSPLPIPLTRSTLLRLSLFRHRSQFPLLPAITALLFLFLFPFLPFLSGCPTPLSSSFPRCLPPPSHPPPFPHLFLSLFFASSLFGGVGFFEGFQSSSLSLEGFVEELAKTADPRGVRPYE